jgi:hypothetical protein
LPLDSSEVDIREQVANVRSAVQITGSPSGEDSPVQLGAAARRDIYLISAEPGTPRRSDPHMPGVIEHVVLCAAARARLRSSRSRHRRRHGLRARLTPGNGLPAALGKAVGFGHVVDIDADHGFT